jgi:RNA polymerase sigma factor (sigma-70 family)
MSTGSRNNLLNYLRAMVGTWRNDPRDDAELLTLFAQTRDEEAFTTLVGRHGSLVWQTCRGVLGEGPDAEDAFQITFLILARQAGRLRAAPLVGWLFRVAQRTALNARSGKRRRQELEHRLQTLPRPETEEGDGKTELYAILQEELAGLPERQRIPLVLRYLEGKTLEEIARIVGCSRPMLSRRLAKGEETLRCRLSRRGLAVTTTALGALLAETANAAVPARLLGKAVQAALASTPEGPKLLLLSIAVAASLLVGLGLIAAPWQAPTAKRDAPSGRDEPPAVVQKDTPAGPTNHADIRGRVLSADGNPIVGAEISALVHRLFMPGEHALHDEILAVAKTDEEGWFSLKVAADFPTWYPERRVTLLVYAAGQALHTEQVRLPTLTAADPNPVEVHLPKPGAVRGRLLDEEGKPARNVKLRLARLGHVSFDPIAAGRLTEELPGWPKVVTDADGHFELAGIGESQKAQFWVEDDRYAPYNLQLTPGETERTVRLSPARWIEGRAIAADTGAPLAGIPLSIHAVGQQGLAPHTVADERTSRVQWTGVVDTRTDANGRFRVRSFPRAPYTLEFYPPAGSPYLPIRKQVGRSAAGRLGDFVLPRGVVVRGTLKETTSKALDGGSVFWDAPVGPDNPNCDPAVIQEAYNVARVDVSGQFTLTVPTGPVRLLAFGPTQGYIARPISQWDNEAGRQSWCLKPTSPAHPTAYCHAETFLELTANKAIPPVTMTLRKGRVIEGEVISANGQPVSRAVLLCSGHVSPLRFQWGQPMVVERGRFVLPGCEEDRVYTVLVLDTKEGQGAMARVSLNGAAPRIRLEPCGAAQVRLDTRNRPLPPSFPAVYPPLFLRLPKPHAVGEQPKPSDTADLVEDFGIDVVAMQDNRRVGKDGELTLPCLIPGAEYILSWQTERGALSLPHTRTFRVKSGELRKLPSVVPGVPRDDG